MTPLNADANESHTPEADAPIHASTLHGIYGSRTVGSDHKDLVLACKMVLD